jgi:phytoene dehydrogenase-like protein
MSLARARESTNRTNNHVMFYLFFQMNDPFVRKWFDYLAFALSGEDAAHTQAAPIAYMMRDLHSDGAVLDYPMGGMDSLIQAIVSGLTRHGGELRLNSRVESLLLEETKGGKATCTGVVLENGKRIMATKAVVCNAPLWNMARILQDSVSDHDAPKSVMDAVAAVQKQADDMCMTGSFMHLHLGIPKAGLPDDLECHHSVLNMDMDVRAEQNMVIISIPTVFDPSLAPEGYHVVHAYTAASDSFDDWLPFMTASHGGGGGGETGKVGANPNSGLAAQYGRSADYQALKEAKAEALWKALERVIPDVRQRAQEKGSIVLIGTPLTHRRYNQRYRGTYGPGPSPGKEVWELGGALTPISNLLACGDTTFPGIGLPGVAASGTIAANTLVPVSQQMELLQELQDAGSLQ